MIKFAKRSGYRDTKSQSALEAFQKDYRRHTSAVRSIFETILATPVVEGEIDITSLFTTKEPHVINEILTPFGFENPREAHRFLKLMAEGPEGVRFSPSVRRSFVELAPIFLRFLRQSPDPDMALRYVEGFANKVGARTSYYAMFRENPAILELLTRLCGTSLFLAELLIAHPESFDILTVPAMMEQPKTLARKQEEALRAIADATHPQAFNALQQYKNGEILRIGMRNILGQTDLWTTTVELSDLAEATLQAMYAHASQQLSHRHGEPLTGDGA